MNFVKKKIYIQPEEMNEHLKECKGKVIVYGPPDNRKNVNNFRQVAYIEDGRVDFKLTTFDDKEGKTVHYICYKDGRLVIPSMCGLIAWVTFSKYYKIPVLIDQDTPEEIANSYMSASAIIGFNKKYNNQRQKAWGYDFNGAYAYALSHYWINTEKPPRQGYIRRGEVGFREAEAPNGAIMMTLAHKGYSNFIFEQEEVPDQVKTFVKVYTQRKQNAKNKEDKKRAKDMINYLVGFLQRRNPYLRALIVCACNEYINSMIDENTLFWNTDSIVSRVRRPDIEAQIGPAVGQWKLEHEGVVAYKGNAYQWNDSVPTYRGIPKNWFKKGFDLLKDRIPSQNDNVWRYSSQHRRLIINKEAFTNGEEENKD